jgi:C4-dicarboxylate-specific signal transduction histidine kinase
MLQPDIEQDTGVDQSYDAGENVLVMGETVDLSELLAQEATFAAQGLFEASDSKEKDQNTASRKAHKHLSMLYRLSEKLRTSTSIDEIVDAGLDLILEAIPSAERAVVMLKSNPRAPLEIQSVKYRVAPAAEQETEPVSRTLLDWVLTEKMVLVSRDVEEDTRFASSESIRVDNVRSIICAPMMRAEKVVGVVYLDSSLFYNWLTQEDAAFAAAAANELALNIDNIRLQKEALKNERMAAIGMTVTNLSHNIRNLITLNQNAIGLMDLHIQEMDNNKLKKNWQWIQQGFSGVHRLAVEMLEYAKEPEIHLKSTDINTMILNWRSSLDDGWGIEGIRFEFKLAESLPAWMMDEVQCQRALLNLVVNAVDAVSEVDDPQITIATFCNEKGQLVISVADNGCGIASDKLNKAVELFFTTKGTKGSGLGLPMVQKFVDQLNGRLKITSQEGKGSDFQMIFPRLASIH